MAATFMAAIAVLESKVNKQRSCECSVGMLHDGAKPSDTSTFTNTTLPRIETGLPIFPPVPTSAGRIVATNDSTWITNKAPAWNGAWVFVPGLKTNLTLLNRVVRVVISMDANKMITVDTQPPDWGMYFTNENTNGPAGVTLWTREGILGDYRIDYSTNLAAKWLK